MWTPSPEHTVRFSALMLVATAIVACTTAGSRAGSSDVALTVTPESAEPGDTVTLVLRNDSQDELGYNLCTSELSRQTGDDAWDPVPSDRACTMELRSLSPRQRATFRIDLPADLAPGTYRFETSVERMARNARETVATEPFTVES